jgi:hypothetical protein
MPSHTNTSATTLNSMNSLNLFDSNGKRIRAPQGGPLSTSSARAGKGNGVGGGVGAETGGGDYCNELEQLGRGRQWPTVHCCHHHLLEPK